MICTRCWACPGSARSPRQPNARPGPNQAVLVVVVGDVAAVEARLRLQLGELLCIVPSRWSKTQLDAVRDYMHDHHQQ